MYSQLKTSMPYPSYPTALICLFKSNYSLCIVATIYEMCPHLAPLVCVCLYLEINSCRSVIIFNAPSMLFVVLSVYFTLFRMWGPSLRVEQCSVYLHFQSNCCTILTEYQLKWILIFKKAATYYHLQNSDGQRVVKSLRIIQTHQYSSSFWRPRNLCVFYLTLNIHL